MNKGFTIVEFLVVIGLLIGFMAIVLTSTMESKEQILQDFDEIMSQYEELINEIDNQNHEQ